MKENIVYKALKESVPIGQLILGIFFSVIGSILTLMIPQVIGKLTDTKAIEYIINQPYIIVFVILFIIFLYGIKTVASYFLGAVGAQSIENVQKKFSSHVLSLPLSKLEKYQAADISSRLTNDIVVISKISAVTIPDMIINSVIVIGGFIFLFSIDLRLTLFVLMIVPIFLLVNMPINKKLEALFKKQQTLLGKISGNFTQSLTNIKLIKSFNAEEDEKTKHFSFFESLSRNMKRMVLVGAGLSSVSEALIVFHLTFLVIYLSYKYYMGGLDVSDLVVFFMYVVQVIPPILQLLSDVTELFEANGAISRLSEILLIEGEESLTAEGVDNFDSSIEFKDVSFSYGQENILNNLNFKIDDKEFVSIVGPSGAGKSTILSLIYKFYTGYEGEIRVGGHDLDKLRAETLRSNVGFILQDNLLISDTIRNNLIYGKNRDLDDNEVKAYTKLTSIDDFINKYDGLDTVVGEDGIQLSEGQRQKINIARNLLSRPKILLLDEPSSSLDAISESTINDLLKEASREMTIVVVAHKLKTVINSDKIIVLNSKGQIEAIGRHQDLLSFSPTYQEFYKMSLLEDRHIKGA